MSTAARAARNAARAFCREKVLNLLNSIPQRAFGRQLAYAGYPVNPVMLAEKFNESSQFVRKMARKAEGGAKKLKNEVKSAVEKGTDGLKKLKYKLKPQDLDFRGTGKTCEDALNEAFKRTGVPKEQFEVTKWGKDLNGKSCPVEWKGPDGAQVNIDLAHEGKITPNGVWDTGPDAPHVGWQTPGKGRNCIVGHIILDEVKAFRPLKKFNLRGY